MARIRTIQAQCEWRAVAPGLNPLRLPRARSGNLVVPRLPVWQIQWVKIMMVLKNAQMRREGAYTNSIDVSTCWLSVSQTTKQKTKNRNQINILSQNNTTAHTHAHNEHSENQSAYTIPSPHLLPRETDKELLTPLLFCLFSTSVSRHRALSCCPRRTPSP